MNCAEFEESVNLYLDSQLSEVECRALEEHMAACPECRALYEALVKAVEAVRTLDDCPLPVNFEEELHMKLESEPKKVSRKGKTWAWIGGIAAGLVVTVVGAAALGSLTGGMAKSGARYDELSADGAYYAAETTAAAMLGMNSYDYKSADLAVAEEEFEYAPAAEPAGGRQVGTVAPNAPETTPEVLSEKLIYTGNINLNSYDFDADLKAVKEKADAVKGYIDSSWVNGQSFADNGSGRVAELQLRVPQAEYRAVVDWLQTVGETTSISENVANVTSQYTEYTIRIENLQKQIDRLQELMSQAEDMNDIISLEYQLSSVTAELECMQGQLKDLDNRVSYSTVTVSIAERRTADDVVKPPVRTYGQKLADALAEGWDDFCENLANFVLWFVGNLGGILLWSSLLVGGPLVVLLVLLGKRRRAGK